MNEMTVKCVAQRRGSTKDSDYHGPSIAKFSEVLRQGLGAEEGRDRLAAWEERWDGHHIPAKSKSQVQPGV